MILKRSFLATFIFFTISFNCLGQGKLDTVVILHNGIELPDTWPPRYSENKVRESMPVPYLKNKPEIISINVGRQLFVDDFLIQETNLDPQYHNATYYKGNPVLEPDQEWEKTFEGAPYAAPFSDGIWYDESDNKFKMWYLAGAGSLYPEKQTFYTGYAESLDGKSWKKINTDVYEGTNIVDTANRDAATIWLDKEEKDKSKRFKMFVVERRNTDKRWQYVLKYSPDGIHWSNGVAQSGDMYDRSTVFFNPFTKKWVLSMRYNAEVGRSRSYLEHADPEMAVSLAHRIRKDVNDKFTVFWFTPDDKEPHHPKFDSIQPQIYNHDAIAYESIMLGYFNVWQGPENSEAAKLGIQKRNEILMGYSRDGFHWSRPSHNVFMGVNETDSAWNWGNVQSIGGVPIIKGDSLYFYVSGRRLNNIMWDGYTSTGLATLRRDGFVSLNSTNKNGYLLTRKLEFDGEYLFVNANIANKGELRVEVLDENGNLVEGYSKAESIPMKENSTKYQLKWKGSKSLSDFKNRPVKLKFYLSKGELYSFWISKWETGESRGFTAGGGPGLSPTGIDVR